MPELGIPAPGLARAALVCVWLATLSSCDAVKSEQSTREFVDDMVTELCAPGAFYRECWSPSTESCHEEMPMLVANALPTSGKRLQPSEALRQHVLERVYFFHYVLVSPVYGPKFEKEACMDETRWKHLPPGTEGDMARLRAKEERGREPSPGPVPDPAPAP